MQQVPGEPGSRCHLAGTRTPFSTRHLTLLRTTPGPDLKKKKRAQVPSGGVGGSRSFLHLEVSGLQLRPCPDGHPASVLSWQVAGNQSSDLRRLHCGACRIEAALLPSPTKS